MRITYSAEADALSVDLVPDGTSAETRRLTPDVAVDLDEDGRLIAVEVLRASQHYPRAELEQLAAPVEWLSLAEAAKESGLSPTTLRVQLNAGRLEGRKRGRDWVVARHVLWTYLENRAPSGRPPAKRKARRRKASRTGG